MVRMITRLSILLAQRFASSAEIAGAGTTTGIEHALKQRDLGERNKQDFKDYKCIDYLNFDRFSFYNKEESMQDYRVPQPSNTKPDQEPKCKTAA